MFENCKDKHIETCRSDKIKDKKKYSCGLVSKLLAAMALCPRTNGALGNTRPLWSRRRFEIPLAEPHANPRPELEAHPVRQKSGQVKAKRVIKIEIN